mgnify:CR=1 FL=1
MYIDGRLWQGRPDRGAADGARAARGTDARHRGSARQQHQPPERFRPLDLFPGAGAAPRLSLTVSKDNGEFLAFPWAFADEKFALYENATALPWHYLVPSYKVVQDEEEIISLLKEGHFDLRHALDRRVEIVECLFLNGGGNLGADLVAKSPPDGYSIMIMSGSFSATSAKNRGSAG